MEFDIQKVSKGLQIDVREESWVGQINNKLAKPG